jgi:hypothetical protein
VRVDDTWLRKVGLVCDECGKTGIIRSCSGEHTKICVKCLDAKVKKDGTKGWKWTVCKVCGETITRGKGRG